MLKSAQFDGRRPMLTEGQPGKELSPGGREWVASELDALELVPFSNPKAAYGPAVELERLARELGAEDLQKRAQLVEADVLGRIGKHTASGQLVREINAWALKRSHRHLLARSHRMLAMFFDSLGDLATSWQHALRAVELTDDTMSDRMRAEHLYGLGMALHRTGTYDHARSRYESALRLAQGAGDVVLQLKLLNNLAWLEDDSENPHRALEISGQMRAFANSHQMTLDAGCLDTIAHAQLRLGQYPEAEATLWPLLADANLEARETEGLAEALRTAVEAQRRQGKLDEAEATLGRCLRVCEERGLGQRRVEAMEEKAMLSAARGDFEQAYHQHIAFHAAEVAMRAQEREANARTLEAVFETEEARGEGERFRELALRDALTGMHNRRFVDGQLPHILGKAVGEGSPLTVALVDIDGFKSVNDNFSHATGDQVLCQLAEVLSSAAGSVNLAARLGGDEFLLVLSGSTAREKLEDLRRAVEGRRWTHMPARLRVTVSIGAARVRPGRTTQPAVLGEADRQLYAAKSAGRNKVVFDPD